LETRTRRFKEHRLTDDGETAMNTNIRIIKRSQRDAKNNATTTAANNDRMTKGDNSRHATRDITGHVTSWVKEFQRKHTPDPRRAFANLFIDTATSTAD
jgi:hypothetical protein